MAPCLRGALGVRWEDSASVDIAPNKDEGTVGQVTRCLSGGGYLKALS